MTPATLRHHYATPVSTERLATLRRAYAFALESAWAAVGPSTSEALRAFDAVRAEVTFCNRALLLEDSLLYGESFRDAGGWRIEPQSVVLHRDCLQLSPLEVRASRLRLTQGQQARLTVYRLARSIMLDAQRAGDRKTRDSMLGIVMRERAELRKQGVRTESPHAYLRAHKPREGWPKTTALRDAPRRKPREQELTGGEYGSDV